MISLIDKIFFFNRAIQKSNPAKTEREIIRFSFLPPMLNIFG